LKSNFHTGVALEATGFAAGAALEAIAAAWWLLDDNESTERAAANPHCGVGGVSVSCTANW
jgi:hypothetical protein